MWNWLKNSRPAWSARTGVFLSILAAVTLACAAPSGAFAADPPDEKPAPPPDSQKKPPSYTDDDLAKYHKPKPADVEPTDEAGPATAAVPAGGPAPAGGPVPQGPAKPASGPGKQAGPARAATRPAPPKPTVPFVDPTAPWKQKDARAAFRENQIKQAREKLAGLESRLEYLNRKRDAIQNPAPVQVGKTVGAAPPDLKPNLTPDPKSARIAPMFPSLPEAQTDQDKENDKSMKLGELLASVEEEMKSVESDIEEAKRDLVTLETRFAQESAQP
ncbi:MAG TPA: hypothetical protein VFB49_13445 [Patescibacteria group bacterium]|nr:hypothetical protein [Patescibacteria group bacterium]